MKKLILLTLVLSACNGLSRQEQIDLKQLKSHGVDIDKPIGNYEKPANPAIAGALNLLPGFGNFYLATGNGGDSNHYVYGALNLLFWPLSIFWGVPEAAIDANQINKKELVYYYRYDKAGKKELAENRIVLE